jgi:hypothetical protein
MTESSPQERALISARAINKMAAEVLRKQRDDLLKSIFKEQMKAIDKWIRQQNDPAIDRSEAIRSLVELGLKGTRG